MPIPLCGGYHNAGQLDRHTFNGCFPTAGKPDSRAGLHPRESNTWLPPTYREALRIVTMVVLACPMA